MGRVRRMRHRRGDHAGSLRAGVPKLAARHASVRLARRTIVAAQPGGWAMGAGFYNAQRGAPGDSARNVCSAANVQTRAVHFELTAPILSFARSARNAASLLAPTS